MVTKTQDQASTATLERRAEPRVKAGHSVLLRPPNTLPMEGCLLDVSSRGARLRVPEPIPVGATVRIEAPGLMLSGTIKRCALNHGAYDAGIVFVRPVEMLGELRKLEAAFLAESEPF
jgi:PilZ domain